MAPNIETKNLADCLETVAESTSRNADFSSGKKHLREQEIVQQPWNKKWFLKSWQEQKTTQKKLYTPLTTVRGKKVLFCNFEPAFPSNGFVLEKPVLTQVQGLHSAVEKSQELCQEMKQLEKSINHRRSQKKQLDTYQNDEYDSDDSGFGSNSSDVVPDIQKTFNKRKCFDQCLTSVPKLIEGSKDGLRLKVIEFSFGNSAGDSTGDSAGDEVKKTKTSENQLEEVISLKSGKKVSREHSFIVPELALEDDSSHETKPVISEEKSRHFCSESKPLNLLDSNNFGVKPIKRERDADQQDPPEEENISLSTSPKKKKLSKGQEKVVKNVQNILDSELMQYESSSCYKDGKELAVILIYMLKNLLLPQFLTTFVHSSACLEPHEKLCLMFKRIFLHVSIANHLCAVKLVYGHILRLHLDSCKNKDCPFPNCEALRQRRHGMK